METVNFTLDEKGYAYDYAPTLVGAELVERGGYFAIHDNLARIKAGQSGLRYAVSFFATDAIATDENSWTWDFGTFTEVKRFFQAVGIRFEETETVTKFFNLSK